MSAVYFSYVLVVLIKNVLTCGCDNQTPDELGDVVCTLYTVKHEQSSGSASHAKV